MDESYGNDFSWIWVLFMLVIMVAASFSTSKPEFVVLEGYVKAIYETKSADVLKITVSVNKLTMIPETYSSESYSSVYDSEEILKNITITTLDSEFDFNVKDKVTLKCRSNNIVGLHDIIRKSCIILN